MAQHSFFTCEAHNHAEPHSPPNRTFYIVIRPSLSDTTR